MDIAEINKARGQVYQVIVTARGGAVAQKDAVAVTAPSERGALAWWLRTIDDVTADLYARELLDVQIMPVEAAPE